MKTLKFSRKKEKGTWKFVKNKLLISCPACGIGVVVEERDVDDQGRIFGFDCYCSFDEDVTLHGYSD